jgi:V-type H+-transporting ATPase subunit C
LTNWSTILFHVSDCPLFPEPTDHYLRTFQWNKVRYRADRPLGELIDTLRKELQNLDNDVKAKFNQYNGVKGTLASLQRKQTQVFLSGSDAPMPDNNADL